MTETPPALAIGTRLGDGQRYEIRQRIGIGGMAEVYRAVDTRLGNRIVAIKTLSASVAQHQFAERMRGLFIQEAQALSRVKDDNVVDVLDFGTSADGTPYMVMEFLSGTDLGVFLKKNKQVPIEQAVDIMLGVCAGVHACHLAGIIHRDLKPANIFLTRTLKGELTKVLDFSVAKVPIARSNASADQAKTDLIVGTPTYMSPEQALGRPANERSDQYSIGGLLYRCLTGRPPQGVLPRPNELRPEISERLEAVILRALEAQPEKRFATVYDLGHGLLPFASPSGRGRWRPYYRTPPQPVDPTTTGTLPRPPVPSAAAPGGAEPATAPSAPATVAANYDFKAHDRTTSLDRDGRIRKLAEAALSTKTTAVDVGVPAGLPSIAAAPPITSVDVPISDATTGPSASNPPVARPRTGVTASSSPSAVRGRRNFVALFGAIAIVVLAVTVIGIRSTRHHEASPPPAAPAWTRPATPSVPAAPPAPQASPVAPSAPGVPVAPKTTGLGEADAPPTATPSPSPRAKRRHRPAPPTETIQYGADGLPILH